MQERNLKEKYLKNAVKDTSELQKQMDKLGKQLKFLKESRTNLRDHVSSAHSQVRSSGYFLKIAVANPQCDILEKLGPLKFSSFDDKGIKRHHIFVD